LEFFMAAQAGPAVFPEKLRSILRPNDLMFVGFTLEDLEFRAVQRSILPWMPNADASRNHVAVQIRPDASWARDPNAARDYLASYFDRSGISIHWSTVAEFLKEFRTRIGADR
jgi:hypothetical protein